MTEELKGLTNKEIAARIAKFKKHRRIRKWPEEHAFLPKRMTIEQANLKIEQANLKSRDSK